MGTNNDKEESKTCSAEVLIGAFTDLFTKYKAYENNLTQKRKYGTHVCVCVYRCLFCKNVYKKYFSTHKLFDIYAYKTKQNKTKNKGLSLQQKTPEIEKSLNLIKHLKKKQEEEEKLLVTMLN